MIVTKTEYNFRNKKTEKDGRTESAYSSPEKREKVSVGIGVRVVSVLLKVRREGQKQKISFFSTHHDASSLLIDVVGSGPNGKPVEGSKWALDAIVIQ